MNFDCRSTSRVDRNISRDIRSKVPPLWQLDVEITAVITHRMSHRYGAGSSDAPVNVPRDPRVASQLCPLVQRASRTSALDCYTKSEELSDARWLHVFINFGLEDTVP